MWRELCMGDIPTVLPRSDRRTYLGRDDVLIYELDEAQDAGAYLLVQAAAALGIHDARHALQPVRVWD